MKIAREKFKTYNDVFDRFTINNLIQLIKKGHFREETMAPIKIGKEANVFSAEGKDKKICIKIYRLETSNFNKMHDYIIAEPRYFGGLTSKRKIIFAWVKREFRNLLVAQKAGLNAPKPIKVLNNILLMEMIGEPAPMLKDSKPEKPEEFFNQVIDNIKKFYMQGYTHGDLSAYNILNHKNKPWLIDFSASTSEKNPMFQELLKRDIHNITKYFVKLGVNTSEEKLIKKIKKEKKLPSS